MECEHKRIRSTNCEYFCLDCGVKLDRPVKVENQPIQAGDEPKKEKPTTRKRTSKTAKKAEKPA